MREFTVIKRDAGGEPVLTYSGVVVERDEDFVCIDAIFALTIATWATSICAAATASASGSTPIAGSTSSACKMAIRWR